ncbi:MAG: hypothetical protein J6T62_06075 [Fibrobacter sp.]|nr:hypothetical protein [Fibrobacter sp.]
MFGAYALDLDEIGSLIANEPVESIYDNVDREEINSSLKDILKANSFFLNGEKIIELFFPSKCCPVFLSHSGLDKSRVEQFAQWLKNNFEINSFIDSDLWGCITDLQREIDQEYKESASKQLIEQYIKSRCSRTPFGANKYESTTHVHIMLCRALTHMIDRAECFIFLGSSNSYSNQSGKKGTFSPWIFHELSMMDIMRKNKNRDSIPKHSQLNCSSRRLECDEGKKKIKVFYPVSCERLVPLAKRNLENWKSCCSDVHDSSLLQRLFEPDNTYPPMKKWEKSLNWLYEKFPPKGDDL